jgi:hypothetical protein
MAAAFAATAGKLITPEMANIGKKFVIEHKGDIQDQLTKSATELISSKAAGPAPAQEPKPAQAKAPEPKPVQAKAQEPAAQSNIFSNVIAGYNSVFPTKHDITAQSKAAGEQFIREICDRLNRPGDEKLRDTIIESITLYLKPENEQNKLAGEKINDSVFHMINRLLSGLLNDDYVVKQIVAHMLDTKNKDYDQIRKIFTDAIIIKPKMSNEENSPFKTLSGSKQMAYLIVENIKKISQRKTVQMGGGDALKNVAKVSGGTTQTEKDMIINALRFHFKPDEDTYAANSKILNAISATMKDHLSTKEAREMIMPIIKTSVEKVFSNYVDVIGSIDIKKRILYLLLSNRPNIKNIFIKAIIEAIDEKMTAEYNRDKKARTIDFDSDTVTKIITKIKTNIDVELNKNYELVINDGKLVTKSNQPNVEISGDDQTKSTTGAVGGLMNVPSSQKAAISSVDGTVNGTVDGVIDAANGLVQTIVRSGQPAAIPSVNGVVDNANKLLKTLTGQKGGLERAKQGAGERLNSVDTGRRSSRKTRKTRSSA